MARTRLSTTVDADLLASARQIKHGMPDSVLIDDVLAALVASHRAAEVDDGYRIYDVHPLDQPDAWGDLAAFMRAAGAT